MTSSNTFVVEKNMVVEDLDSSTYHSLSGSFSSSQLKTINKDVKLFFDKYIAKTTPKEHLNAFDIGTYFHTAILEPHKLLDECAVWQGRRAGAEWKAFAEANKNKAIITGSEHERITETITVVKASEECMKYIDGYKKEVSAFVYIYVYGGEVYSVLPDEKLYVLELDGWEISDEDKDEITTFGTKLMLKARADAINFEDRIISDLKTTSGNTSDKHEMKSKVSNLDYELSAALYADIFTASFGEKYERFVWIFASKDMNIAKPWEATKKNMQVGRAKWRKAVLLLAKYIDQKWEIKEETGYLDPNTFELSWIDEWRVPV